MQNKFRVLVVDDDNNIRKLASMSLERVGGWQVVAVSSGEEALELVAAQRPDVILLDLMMPGLDGRTTLSRLKSRPDVSQIPVILMTAKAQTDEMSDFLSLGAVGVITKPFDPMRLSQEVSNLLPCR